MRFRSSRSQALSREPREPHFPVSPPALAKIAAWLGCQGLRSNRYSGLTLTDKTSRKIIKRQAVARPPLRQCGSDCSPFSAALAAVPGGVSRRIPTRRNIDADPRRAVCGVGLRQGEREPNYGRPALRALPANGGTCCRPAPRGVRRESAANRALRRIAATEIEPPSQPLPPTEPPPGSTVRR